MAVQDIASHFFMKATQLLAQLHAIYLLLLENEIKKAEEVFGALKIVDTAEHLRLPKNIRYLIWDLYEYLIVGDENNATDKKKVIDDLRDLLQGE